MMKGPGGRALQFTFWPLEETHWPWPSVPPPPGRLMTLWVGPGLPASRTLLIPMTVRCDVIASAPSEMPWKESDHMSGRVRPLVPLGGGKMDIGHFYAEAQWVSPGTSQNNPRWQFERKTGGTRIKIIENGRRWLNGRWAAGAGLHADASCSGVRLYLKASRLWFTVEPSFQSFRESLSCW